ncbi:hypothetical protein V6N13_099791 [Hibiscus sabdariffa]
MASDYCKRRISTVTLFVQNIPTAFYWSGLLQVFGRHGDVVNSYIARKKDRLGKRFGFVRFSNRVNADRAIERLNGFVLNGFKLFVSEAKYGGYHQAWRYTSNGKSMGNNTTRIIDDVTQKNHLNETKGKIDGEADDTDFKVYKKVQGHIEEETLRKLESCLVGTMATICSSSNVEERLNRWGLGDVKVKKPWTEAYRIPERVTWIQVSGIPLHCWNDTTFNRIATVWGSLLALGENANQSIDCDKITMLVSTRLRENLTKVIELEVGRESFLISIVELGFQITSSKIEKEKTRQKLPSSPEDSSSGTSSSISPMSNGKVTCSKEVEVSLDCCMGNTFKVGVTLNDVNERRLVGEDAILGSCQLVQKVSKEMSHSWPEREKETVENLNKVDQSRLEGATSGSESDQQDDLLVEKVNQYSQPRDIVQKDVEEEGLVGQKENLSTSKCSRRLAGLARLLWCWSWFVE